MKTVRNLQYFWHTMRAHYFTVIANDCLDKDMKHQLVEKAEAHKSEAIQCRTKIQDLTC
ncbi:hypothetical protein [Sutcliffiella horikoshii]|uniref:hypothetical protein n=1 Tax=Sutcliffiella horikoshii TaxID=79883 RepID=UPI001F1E8938|nr:hypothetical protein [Sutcliffiella horikoshii]